MMMVPPDALVGIWRAGDHLQPSNPIVSSALKKRRSSRRRAGRILDYSAKLGRRRDVADGVDLFTVPPTSRSKPCQRRHDAANTQRAP
jgi:hypothetical protein